MRDPELKGKKQEISALIAAQHDYKKIVSFIDVLWPVRIDIHEKHLVVRFVTLEKNVAAYFPRQCYTTDG